MIEALSGTIYDYDDVCDNRRGYFDYDDPYDYEEWYGWDGPVEGKICYDPYRSDIAGGGTIFSQAWSDDRSTGFVSTPKPTVTEVGDRPSSIGPDLQGVSADKTESYRTAFGADFGNLFTGETYALEPDDNGDTDRPLSPGESETNVMRTPAPDDTKVGDQPSSSDSDHPRESESNRTEFGLG